MKPTIVPRIINAFRNLRRRGEIRRLVGSLLENTRLSKLPRSRSQAEFMRKSGALEGLNRNEEALARMEHRLGLEDNDELTFEEGGATEDGLSIGDIEAIALRQILERQRKRE